MESLLTFADELERRDADVAQALLRVERLQHEVDEVRAHAAAARAFIAGYPAALAECEADIEAASAACVREERAVANAEAGVAAARRDDDRLAAERTLQHARDGLHAAEGWAAEAADARARLEDESVARAAEAERLAACADELARSVRGVPEPAGGLNGVLDWSSRARGALLVQRSGLASERDVLVREASELLGSVLGEPLTATAVAGVRDRLERALGTSST